MTARLEIGGERYTITNGQVTADDPATPVELARAEYMNAVAKYWVDEARDDGKIGLYDPDRDCTMATVLADRLKGRPVCQQHKQPPRGTVE